MAKVSIVIPAYNEELYVGRTLESILKLPKEDIIEILLIDNGSIDATQKIVSDMLHKFENKLRLIIETKKGVAWARARGAKEAKGDIIFFIDADTEVTADWFSKVLSHFSNDTAVCVSGPTYYYDVDLIMRAGTAFFWWFSADIISKIIGYMGNFANLAIRTESLKKIGGIDTSIEFYGDDTNLTRRLSKIGKVVFHRKFYIYASGRRFNAQGMLKTTLKYSVSFFSEILLNKRLKEGYTEIR